MKNNLKQIYQRAYANLLERFANNPEVLDRILSGKLAVNPVVYYFRRQLSTATTKYLQDWSQARLTGITNFVDGKFPYKMTAAFSHVGIAYAYSTTDVAANTLKYSNNLYNPTQTGEATVNARNYAVEADWIDTDIVNSELTLGLGDITLFNRTPMAQFFKQARYQTDAQAKGGVMSIENAIELYEPVSVTDANEPQFEITWNNGASLTNYSYLEFALHGVEVAVR